MFTKSSQKNQHSALDSANKKDYNIVKNKGREQKEDMKNIQKVLKRPSSKKQVDNCF